MKNIKTVEINVDHLNAIENEPDKFVKALSDAIRAGGYCGSRENENYQNLAHSKLLVRGAEIVGH